LASSLLKASANMLGLLERTHSEYDASFEQPIDRGQVESIVARRAAARAAKNWAESDRLRDELLALGFVIRDNKDGTTSWEFKR
jgi:cysteinyl-tRNA synthetase